MHTVLRHDTDYPHLWHALETSQAHSVIVGSFRARLFRPVSLHASAAVGKTQVAPPCQSATSIDPTSQAVDIILPRCGQPCHCALSLAFCPGKGMNKSLRL